MPITTNWYNTEKTILYIKYTGVWTLAEYHENIALNAKTIKEQSHWVVTIGDFSEGQAVPSRFLSSGQHSENITPSNNAGMILFGLNTYMALLAKMFAKVFPKSTQGMVIASNQNEALEIAHKILQTSQKRL
jgi:hypothetical protein